MHQRYFDKLVAEEKYVRNTSSHLFGAAEALRDISGTLVEAPDRPAYDSAVAAVRAALGEAACAAAWAEGRALPLDQAIDYALAEEGPAPAATGKGLAAAADSWRPTVQPLG
jgi:hypothetical protein